MVVITNTPHLYKATPLPIYSRYIRVRKGMLPVRPTMYSGAHGVCEYSPYRSGLAVVRGTPSAKVGHNYYISFGPTFYILSR